MRKLQKISFDWYVTDKTCIPTVGSPVVFKGLLGEVTYVNEDDETCIIELVDFEVSKNTSFDTIEVIIIKLDQINLDELLSKISRVEVIDEKGRSYVKYLDRSQKVEFSFQDEDRTLKVFINEKDISE